MPPSTEIGTLIHLKMLYLDDARSDLRNFQSFVNRFNRNPEAESEDIAHIELETTDDPVAVVERMDDLDVDVFVCDHNMPERKGFQLIQSLLKPANPDLVYVLYTGGNNEAIEKECRANGIIYHQKGESLGNLMEKIVRNYQTASERTVNSSPLEDFYRDIAKDLLNEMKEIERIDPEFVVVMGDREFTVTRMIKEINTLSDYGLKYLKGYIEGLKFFKNR